MSDETLRAVAKAQAIERKIAFLKRQPGLSDAQRSALCAPLQAELDRMLADAAAPPAVAPKK